MDIFSLHELLSRLQPGTESSLDVIDPMENVTACFIAQADERDYEFLSKRFEFILALNMNGPGLQLEICGVSVITIHFKNKYP